MTDPKGEIESQPRFQKLNQQEVYITAVALQLLLTQPHLDSNKNFDEADLHNAVVLEPNPQIEIVDIGNGIVVEFVEYGEEDTFTIVGSYDQVVDKSYISYKSPLAQALLGHKAGEVVTYKAYDSLVHVRIVQILPGAF